MGHLIYKMPIDMSPETIPTGHCWHTLICLVRNDCSLQMNSCALHAHHLQNMACRSTFRVFCSCHGADRRAGVPPWAPAGQRHVSATWCLPLHPSLLHNSCVVVISLMHSRSDIPSASRVQLHQKLLSFRISRLGQPPEGTASYSTRLAELFKGTTCPWSSDDW